MQAAPATDDTKPTDPALAPHASGDPAQSDPAAASAAASETPTPPKGEPLPDLPEVLARSCARFGLNDEEIEAVQADVLAAVESSLQSDQDQREQARSAIVRELKQAWGTEADAAMEAASFAALSFGLDEDDVDDLLDIGQPDRIIPALARVGLALRRLDEEGPQGELAGQSAGMTAEAATQELARLAADRDHREAFLNRAHPGHDAAKAHRARLLAAATTGHGAEAGGAALV